MDRASIIALEEVCQRCHLYTKRCGMLEYPSQCVDSGHFIDGYRKAEKNIIALIESRLSELLGDARPTPILRNELQDLIKKIKEEQK